MILWSRNLLKSHVPCVVPLMQRTRKTFEISMCKAHSPSLAFCLWVLFPCRVVISGKGMVQGNAHLGETAPSNYTSTSAGITGENGNFKSGWNCLHKPSLS